MYLRKRQSNRFKATIGIIAQMKYYSDCHRDDYAAVGLYAHTHGRFGVTANRCHYDNYLSPGNYACVL